MRNEYPLYLNGAWTPQTDGCVREDIEPATGKSLFAVHRAGPADVETALASAAADTPVDKYTAVFGEVGLTGEVRSVSFAEKRVNECIKTGFRKVILPAKCMASCRKFADKIQLVPVSYVNQMIKELSLRPAPNPVSSPSVNNSKS